MGTQAAELSQAKDTLLEARDELEQEVAERKAVEESLRESEEKMRVRSRDTRLLERIKGYII